MAAQGRDDRDAVDAAFAEMVSQYHLTAERPDAPSGSGQPAVAEEPGTQQAPRTLDTSWANAHPLFTPPPEANAVEEPEVEEPDGERFEPGPPPMPRPAWPALLGWLSLGYSILFMLASVVGVGLPGWAGWLAILGFVGGVGVLFSRLPRSRPPDAGDGAVV